MGWGAAHALAEEWAEWCSGPEEAYEILYGKEADRPAKRFGCPDCKKKFRSKAARNQHHRDVHKTTST